MFFGRERALIIIIWLYTKVGLGRERIPQSVLVCVCVLFSVVSSSLPPSQISPSQKSALLSSVQLLFSTTVSSKRVNIHINNKKREITLNTHGAFYLSGVWERHFLSQFFWTFLVALTSEVSSFFLSFFISASFLFGLNSFGFFLLLLAIGGVYVAAPHNFRHIELTPKRNDNHNNKSRSDHSTNATH